MQAMVTLTSEESKRLIAKAIADMVLVKKAKNVGYIGFAMCTSCGYIAQEVFNKNCIDISRYCSGFIYNNGSCCVPDKSREKLLFLEKGKPIWLKFPQENFSSYIDRMGTQDIIIKSGNLMDSAGNVGVLLASPDGGEAGAYLPKIAARGIQLIVPMTVNKTVPMPLSDIMPYMGISKFKHDRVQGMSCGMTQLHGLVITEIEAFLELAHIKAVPAAMGGVGSGNGTVTFVLHGKTENVEAAWQLVMQIKGEKQLKNNFSSCKHCSESNLQSGGARCATRLKT